MKRVQADGIDHHVNVIGDAGGFEIRPAQRMHRDALAQAGGQRRRIIGIEMQADRRRIVCGQQINQQGLVKMRREISHL